MCNSAFRKYEIWGGGNPGNTYARFFSPKKKNAKSIYKNLLPHQCEKDILHTSI